MDVDRRASRFEGRHVLSHQARRKTGKHVPRTGRCQKRRAICVDSCAAIRRCNHGIGTLINDNGVGAGGGGAGSFEFGRRGGCDKIGKQPLELAVMGRQHQPDLRERLRCAEKIVRRGPERM